MREGWREASLAELARYDNGYPFKPSDLGSEGLPVVRIKQLLDPTEPVDRSTVSVPSRNRLNDGDLVFSWSGTLAVRLWDRGPALLNQHLFRVVEREGVLREWLCIALDHAIAALGSRTHGTTMRHITKPELERFRLVVPGLAEQRRIVDLVAAADDLASAAATEREAARIALVALREDLISASAFPKRPLAHLLTDIDGGYSPVTEGRRPLPGERAVLKLSAIRPARFDGAEAKAIAPDVILPVRALVKEGDVLITRSNTPNTVGAVCRVHEVPANTYLSDLVLRLHPGPDVDGRYLAEALNTQAARRQITTSAKGTSGSMRKISRGTIHQFEIPLPASRQAQEQIARILRDAGDLVEAADSTAIRVGSLRQVLVHGLLAGARSIPSSYDRFLDGAA